MFENFDSSGGWNLTFLKHGVIPAKAGTSSKFVNQNYQVQQQQLLNQQISKLFLCKDLFLQKHGVIPAKAGTSSKFVNQNYQVSCPKIGLHKK
jgi:sulfur relay (sulfurtransferase) complex TusBCD TusD component (DsrE family)